MWQDTIKLGFFNNLVIGFVPPVITLERIANKLEQEHNSDIESYGLFDSSSPNYTTFYPEVTAEDLKPKDEEFIEPVFRALSEVIVHKNWNPVDFSTPGVLKKSLGLLQGSTVNPDHESHVVGNAIGAVSKVAWQNSYKTDGGIIVPAGINAVLKIDGKSNPRIARGILMTPPSIHSSSVTVQFLWDKSHPSLSDEEFFGKLGTFDKEGKMIRRMATRIKKYPEISLVHHGADPYAQKVGKDGAIVNPEYADISYNSAEAITSRKEQKFFCFDFKTDLIENNEKFTIPAESNDNKNNSMEALLLALATALGMTGDKHTQESILAEFTARTTRLNELQTANTTLTAAATTSATEIARLKLLEDELVALKAKTPDTAKLTALELFQTTTLGAARTRITALYNKTKSNKPDQAILNMILAADLPALEALETQYTTELDVMFPSSCKKCGSKDITKASVIPGKPAAEEAFIEKSDEETRETLAEKKRKQNSIPFNQEKK